MLNIFFVQIIFFFFFFLLDYIFLTRSAREQFKERHMGDKAFQIIEYERKSRIITLLIAHILEENVSLISNISCQCL